MKEVTDDIFNSISEDISQTDVLREDINNDAKKRFYNHVITFSVCILTDSMHSINEDVLFSTTLRYIKLVCDAFVHNGDIVNSEIKTKSEYSMTKNVFDVYYYYTENPFYGIRQLINFLVSFIQTPLLPNGFIKKIIFGNVIYDDANSENVSFSDKTLFDYYISFEYDVIMNLYNRRFYDMDTSQMQFGKLCELAMKVIKPNISWYDSLLYYLGDEINMFDSMLNSYIINKGQKTYQSSEVHRFVKPILNSATLSGNDKIENKKSGNYILFCDEDYDEETGKETFEKELKIANIQYIYLQNIEKTKSTSLKMHYRDIDENDKGRKILSWRIIHAYPSDLMFGYLGLCRNISKDGIENAWIEMLVIDPNPHARNVEFSLERNGYLLGRSIAAVINEKLPREFREGFIYDEVKNNIEERHAKYIENMKIIDEEVYKIKRGII